MPSGKLRPFRVSLPPLHDRPNLGRCTGHKARPEGAGRTDKEVENGNDENPALPVRREQLPEPQ